MLRRFVTQMTLAAIGVCLLFTAAAGGVAHADEPLVAATHATTIQTTQFGQNSIALVVVPGDTNMVLLDAMLLATQGRGAWAQTSDGIYVLYVRGGPAFVNQGFISTFPNGWAIPTSLMFIK